MASSSTLVAHQQQRQHRNNDLILGRTTAAVASATSMLRTLDFGTEGSKLINGKKATTRRDDDDDNMNDSAVVTTTTDASNNSANAATTIACINPYTNHHHRENDDTESSTDESFTTALCDFSSSSLFHSSSSSPRNTTTRNDSTTNHTIDTANAATTNNNNDANGLSALDRHFLHGPAATGVNTGRRQQRTTTIASLILVQDSTWKVCSIIHNNGNNNNSNGSNSSSNRCTIKVQYVHKVTRETRTEPPTAELGYLAYHAVRTGIRYHFDARTSTWVPPVPDLELTNNVNTNDSYFHVLVTDNHWKALCFKDNDCDNNNNNSSGSGSSNNNNAVAHYNHGNQYDCRRIYYCNVSTKEVTWDAPNLDIGYLALDSINTGIHYVRNLENGGVWGPPIPPAIVRTLAYHRSHYCHRVEQHQADDDLLQQPQRGSTQRHQQRQQQQQQQNTSREGRRRQQRQQERNSASQQQQEGTQISEQRRESSRNTNAARRSNGRLRQHARQSSRFQSRVFRRLNRMRPRNDQPSLLLGNDDSNNDSSNRSSSNNDAIPSDLYSSNGSSGRDVQGSSSDDILRSNVEGANRTSNGASVEEINLFPLRYLTDPNDCLLRKKSCSKENSNNGLGDDSTSPEDRPHCAICLEEYKLMDCVRTIPCFHTYHSDCINSWLLKNATCPICKFRVVS